MLCVSVFVCLCACSCNSVILTAILSCRHLRQGRFCKVLFRPIHTFSLGKLILFPEVRTFKAHILIVFTTDIVLLYGYVWLTVLIH